MENAKTLIITNVSPSLSAYAETVSSLRFAQRAKLVKNTAVVNKDILGNVSALQAEIYRLKEALAAKESNNMMVHQDDALSLQNLSSIVRLGTAIKDLKLRQEMLEDLLSRKDQQLQSERMILKFRESELFTLKKGTPYQESERIARLEAEVLEYQRMQKMNPEISRLVYENSQQAARIQSLEAFSMGLDEYLAREQEKSMEAVEAAESILKHKRDETLTSSMSMVDPLSGTMLENLQLQNQMLRDEIDSMRSLNGTSEDLEELQTELGIKDVEIQRLETLLSSLSENKAFPIKRLASSSEDLSAELLASKLEREDDHSTSKSVMMATLNASLVKAEKMASDLTLEKERLLTSCSLLERQISTLETSNVSLEGEIDKLKDALSNAHESISTAETRASAAEASRLAALERCSALEEKLFNSEAKLGTCSAKMISLEESIGCISGELASIKSELKLAEDENVELKTKLQLSIEQINHINSHSKRLEDTLMEKKRHAETARILPLGIERKA